MAFYQLFHLILHEIDRFGCFMLKSGFFSKSLVLCLKIGHYGRLGRLDGCHVTQNTRDLLPSSFWDGMFLPNFRISRREDINGETDIIVTFLLKLSSQWVKYALGCVYIDSPLAATWRLFVFYIVSSAVVVDNCWKEKSGLVQTSIISCTELNTYLGRPK